MHSKWNKYDDNDQFIIFLLQFSLNLIRKRILKQRRQDGFGICCRIRTLLDIRVAEYHLFFSSRSYFTLTRACKISWKINYVFDNKPVKRYFYHELLLPFEPWTFLRASNFCEKSLPASKMRAKHFNENFLNILLTESKHRGNFYTRFVSLSLVSKMSARISSDILLVF